MQTTSSPTIWIIIHHTHPHTHTHTPTHTHTHTTYTHTHHTHTHTHTHTYIYIYIYSMYIILARYKLDVVGVQEVRWDKEGTVRAGDYNFFYGKGMRWAVHVARMGEERGGV